MSEAIRWSLVALGLSSVVGVALVALVHAAKARRAPVRSCRVCGCTDDAPCDDLCWWELPDLCSQCVAAAHIAAVVGPPFASVTRPPRWVRR